MSDYDEETTCPLCMDPLDATDQAINFCQCGYKMCLWCWNQLMETAAREALPGRCPNCRTEYDKDKITMAQLDPDALHREQQRRKETKKKANEAQHRPPKALGQVRVVQRNLVYAVGMPLSICREEMLADKQYFGAFGRIKKVSVNRSTPFSQVQKNGPSGSAYVTYYRPEDALRCIEAVDGTVWEGKPIKACFGTTKYCNAFLKGVPCNNADCLYLHDIAEASDSFSKEDMMVNGVATARSTFFDMVHPTSTKEASAHAHAVLRNNGHHAAAPAAAAPACSSVQAAAGCATTAAPAASRVPTPPMAITGARRTSSTTSPWGSVGADNGPATASPNRPGAAMMARWASTARATPPATVPLNSPLADVEWPSLGAAAESSDSKLAASDQQHAAAGHAAAAGGRDAAATAAAVKAAPPPGWGAAAAAAGHAAHPQHPSASASSHPVSHPVGQQAPTAAAVVAGKASAAGAATSKQQQQEAKQAQKVMANLGKAPQKSTATNAKQQKADAVGAEAAPEEQQQNGSNEPPVAVAEALVDNSNKSNVGKGANGQVNGKLTKQEAKRAAKAAAKAEKEAAKAEKAAAKEAATTKDKETSAMQAAAAAEDAAATISGNITLAAGIGPAPAAKAPPGFAAAAAGPPGFPGAAKTPARAKGPPPGFAAATQAPQRTAPPGFEPSLLALARGGSGGNLSQQQGSSGGGAPPAAVPAGLSPLGFGAAAGSGLGSGAASVNGVGSRRSSEVGSADGAVAAAVSDGEALSRPESRAGSVHGHAAAAAATPVKAAAAADRPQSPAGPSQQYQQQQQLSPPGAAAVSPSMPSPVFGMQLLSPQPPLFGAAGNASSGFDINAFLGSPTYDLPGVTAPVPTGPQPLGFGSVTLLPHENTTHHTPLAAAAAGGGGLGSHLFGAVGFPPVAATAGQAAAAVDAAAPLSARKQSRWGFAQQPQQQQQQPAAPLPFMPGAASQQEQQQGGVRPPPGFGVGGGAPAGFGSQTFGASNGHAGFGGFGGPVNATSFFKQLLPGVNVHVAASPPTSTGVPGSGSAAAQPAGAAGNTPPNPGLALLQQLQRGQQQPFQQY